MYERWDRVLVALVSFFGGIFLGWRALTLGVGMVIGKYLFMLSKGDKDPSGMGERDRSEGFGLRSRSTFQSLPMPALILRYAGT